MLSDGQAIRRDNIHKKMKSECWRKTEITNLALYQFSAAFRLFEPACLRDVQHLPFRDVLVVQTVAQPQFLRLFAVLFRNRFQGVVLMYDT